MKNLDLLIPKEQPQQDRWTWATVTTSSPLRIRLDGESAALDINPENLVGVLYPGERVWCQITGRRILVIGRAQGAGVPTGSVQMFMSETTPDGWLRCTGDTFDKNVYPVLYDVLGTDVLPDMRRRFPLGWEYAVSPPVGDLYGSEYIGVNEMPPHFHDMSHEHPDGYASGGNHYHNIMFEQTANTPNSGTGYRVTDISNNGAGGGGTNYNGNTTTNGHTHWVDIPVQYQNTANQGGGAAYWPRFIVVNYIIKT